MDKKITFAHVYTQPKDAVRIAELNMQVSPKTHILTGQPFVEEGRWVGMHAVNNYGEDDEPIGIRIIKPEPPRLSNGSISTDSDIGINYKLPSSYTTLSTRDFIRWVHWSATNLPSGLSIDPDTGYIKGLVTSGGIYNSTITVETNNGKASATFTLSVTAYSYLTRIAAPDCPVEPGSYSGRHTHTRTVQVPMGFQQIQSIMIRSSTSYGGRSLDPTAEGASRSSIVDYTTTTSKGKTKKYYTSVYKAVKVSMNISAGWGDHNKTYVRYKDAHFLFRVKILEYVPQQDQGKRTPRGVYIDVDATYDFYEEPNFKYDKYGNIITYS